MGTVLFIWSRTQICLDLKTAQTWTGLGLQLIGLDYTALPSSLANSPYPGLFRTRYDKNMEHHNSGIFKCKVMEQFS